MTTDVTPAPEATKDVAPARKVRSAAGSLGVAPYLQATPLALILGVFLLVPIATIVMVSFWDYDFARIIPDFV